MLLIFNFVLSKGPLVLYKRMVEDGKLQHDSFQEKVAMEFEDLLLRLEHYEKEMEAYHVSFWSSH